jgi:hypothetical protein
MEEFIELIGVGILLFLIFLGMASPVIIIGLIYFLKKRLDHKQVMAAIEKGTPLSDLKPLKRTGPLWIKNLTAGIALIVISAGLVGFRFVCSEALTLPGEVWGWFFVALILFAIGVSRLIRGLLQRRTEKAQRQIQPSNQINPAQN